MIKLFKSFTPQTVVLVLIFTIVLKLGYIIYPINQELIHSNSSDWLNEYIYSFFEPNSAYPIVIGMILIVCQALLINRLCTEYKLLQQDSFIPAAIYILITSLNPWYNVFSSATISSTIILFVLNNILRIQVTSMPKKLMYNSGLFIGLSAIIYWPSIVLFLFVIWAYIISKKFNGKEVIALFLGVITLLYVALSGLYLLDYPLSSLQLHSINYSTPDITTIKDNWLSLSCLGLLLVMGIVSLNQNFRKTVESTKKMWWSVILFMIMGTVIPFIKWEIYPINAQFFIIPSTLIIANIWMSDINKWIKIVLFWITILSITINQYNLA